MSTISRFWWTPPCAKISFFGLGAKTHWCWSESLLYMSESIGARWKPGMSWGGLPAEFSLCSFSLFGLFLPIQLLSKNLVSTASCCILVSECLAVCWLGLGPGLTSGASCPACLWVSASHFWLSQPTQLLSKNAVSALVCSGSVLVYVAAYRHDVVSCWVVHTSACPGTLASISLSGGGEGQG